MPNRIRQPVVSGLLATLAAAHLLVVVGCSTSGPRNPAATPPPVGRSQPFLVDPLAGYPQTVDGATLDRLSQAFRRLTDGGEIALAAAEIAELLAVDPGLHPARVVAAQIDLLEDRPRDAQRALEAVVDALPQYDAAALVLGWAAEQNDDVLTAFGAYTAIADRRPVAAERSTALRPRAIDILINRIDQALVQGRIEEGEALVERLERWAPDEERTAEAGWWLAVAREDSRAERAALEALLAFDPERRDADQRLAGLLIESGDIQGGLERYQALLERYPDDFELSDEIERAQFRWRLQTLPDGARELADRSSLNRAELATLVYWLVPEIRYAELVNPPIATDILDHPQREPILRVINFEILRVDETLHRFRPADAANRVSVLRAFVTLLRRSGKPLACLSEVSRLELARSEAVVCRAAARCGLLREEAECLPTAAVSGEDVLEIYRRALVLLEG